MHARLSALVALALLGCKQRQPPRDAPPPPPIGPARGTFALTYYWVSAEADAPSAPANTTIYDKQCAPIAKVSARYAARLDVAGSGKLSDNRLLTISGECSCRRSPCFRVTDAPWGIGADNRPLVPFRSIAVDRKLIDIGTTLWIEQLEGTSLPGEPPAQHDGCVVADDTGGRIIGERIDWFVGREPYYRDLDKALQLTQVDVFDGGARCQ